MSYAQLFSNICNKQEGAIAALEMKIKADAPHYRSIEEYGKGLLTIAAQFCLQHGHGYIYWVALSFLLQHAKFQLQNEDDVREILGRAFLTYGNGDMYDIFHNWYPYINKAIEYCQSTLLATSSSTTLLWLTAPVNQARAVLNSYQEAHGFLEPIYRFLALQLHRVFAYLANTSHSSYLNPEKFHQYVQYIQEKKHSSSCVTLFRSPTRKPELKDEPIIALEYITLLMQLGVHQEWIFYGPYLADETSLQDFVFTHNLIDHTVDPANTYLNEQLRAHASSSSVSTRELHCVEEMSRQGRFVQSDNNEMDAELLGAGFDFMPGARSHK